MAGFKTLRNTRNSDAYSSSLRGRSNPSAVARPRRRKDLSRPSLAGAVQQEPPPAERVRSASRSAIRWYFFARAARLSRPNTRDSVLRTDVLDADATTRDATQPDATTLRVRDPKRGTRPETNSQAREPLAARAERDEELRNFSCHGDALDGSVRRTFGITRTPTPYTTGSPCVPRTRENKSLLFGNEMTLMRRQRASLLDTC